VSKSQQAKKKAGEAFEKVRPEVRDLTAAALVQGVRAAVGWLMAGRLLKGKEKQDG